MAGRPGDTSAHLVTGCHCLNSGDETLSTDRWHGSAWLRGWSRSPTSPPSSPLKPTLCAVRQLLPFTPRLAALPPWTQGLTALELRPGYQPSGASPLSGTAGGFPFVSCNRRKGAAGRPPDETC